MLITASVFQFRLRLSPPSPACRLCLNPGHNRNDCAWPFQALALPRRLRPIATTAVEPPAPFARLWANQPTHSRTACRAKSQSVCRQASAINQVTLSPRPACLWLFKVLALQQSRWAFLPLGLKATCAIPNRCSCSFARALACQPPALPHPLRPTMASAARRCRPSAPLAARLRLESPDVAPRRSRVRCTHGWAAP